MNDAAAAIDLRWKWVLLTSCAIACFASCAAFADGFGLGGTPWYGFWDDNLGLSAPYVVDVVNERPDGAAARAGLRNGDRIDLREQSFASRFYELYQPIATRTHMVRVTRGSAVIEFAVRPSTVYESASAYKSAVMSIWPLADLCFIACATLIAVRRWWQREARLLAFLLLAFVGFSLNPAQLVFPNAAAGLAQLLLSGLCTPAMTLLFLRLSSLAGTRSRARSALEIAIYGFAMFEIVAAALPIVGIATLWIDPLPSVPRLANSFPFVFEMASRIAVVVLGVSAVRTTEKERRPRVAWLLLPLPIASLLGLVLFTLGQQATSWYATIAINTLGEICSLLGALAVTYSLVRRRVLDFDFVFGRTLVVATVSLIVVASFVLLEWMLGTFLAGASHATGLIANGALALALGLSMSVIHRRVDRIVDAVLFRKRREDEAALRDFAKEAAYVTDRDALLDGALERLRRHSDAREAALLLGIDRSFESVRQFGTDEPIAIGENDDAILALRAWHKPLDPHRHVTALRGALALPMLARGRLSGIVLLGERAGGEAYAPDDIEALAQFAHGVGIALDALGNVSEPLFPDIQRSLDSIAEGVAALLAATRRVDGSLTEPG